MQSYFQRMFSCQSPSVSHKVTLFSSLGCIITGIPMMLIGVAANAIGAISSLCNIL